MQLISDNKKNYLLIIYLFFALPALCQRDIGEIQASFKEYVRNNVSEKIFVHTDKDFYLAGEIAWLKLYVVNAGNNKPIDLSKLAYVEILDENEKPVLQNKLSIHKGKGNGSLYLPVLLNSGVYRLRVYTNWMKNFGAAYFFEKPITIVNTLKRLTIRSASSRSYDLQFFPEGGNLVQHLQSKIAFKFTDQSGKGIDCDGFIVRNNNDTIIKFRPLKFGIGHFNFTPEAGDIYKAVIKLTDTLITTEFPKAIENGYVLNVNDVSGTKLKINIATNIQQAGFINVFIHTRQNLELAEKVFFDNGVAELIVEKNKLGEGISRITVFNSEMLPVCERLYYVKPKQKINIQTKIDKEQYGSRNQVKLTVNTTDESGNPVPADMSVAVYRIDSLEKMQNSTIINYFWLTSELKGRIESPEYYFSETGFEADEAIDNLMLTHGWRRFAWQNVLQQTKPVYAFVPEYQGHIIYAMVIDSMSGLPAAGVLTYLSVPGSRVQLYGSRSDSNGIAVFYTKDFYGSNEIVLQTEKLSNRSYRVEIISPFSDKFLQEKLPQFDLPKNTERLLTDYSTAMQVQNNFYGNKLKQFYIPAFDTTAFFGTPDKQYKLDDYTRFSTMEEVLREFVFEVLVRRQKENFHLIMADIDNKIFLDDPITLFNGVPVFDPNKIMQYDPLKIREIDIVKSKYYFGPLIMNGIINFITYHPDPAMLSDLNGVVLEYEGVQYHREFYSPVYEKEEDLSGPLPDFRNVLYWSPEIQTDTKGKTEFNFFTSDLKGKYIVMIQGMNTDGRLGEKSISFEVK